MALIHLDAGVVIGFLDAEDVHHEAASRTVSAAVRSRDRLEMSASVFAEILVAPSRRGDDSVEGVRRACRRLPIGVVPVDEDIAATAAAVRAANRSMRLPDALVVATAVNAGAARLVTTDRRWPSAEVLGFPGAIERL